LSHDTNFYSSFSLNLNALSFMQIIFVSLLLSLFFFLPFFSVISSFVLGFSLLKIFCSLVGFSILKTLINYLFIMYFDPLIFLEPYFFKWSILFHWGLLDENLSNVCFWVSKVLLEKFKILNFFLCSKIIYFLVFLDHFNMLMSKIIFFFLKNIILIHLWVKNTLKSNHNHTPNHVCKHWVWLRDN